MGQSNKKAVEQVSKLLKWIRLVYFQEQSGVVNEGIIAEFKVNVKLTFEIE